MGENPDDFVIGNDFSDIPLKVQYMIERTDKQNSLK